MMHHKTFFPIIVGALTVLLALFIYSTFKERIHNPPAGTPVTAVEYQSHVQTIAGSLPAALAAVASDADRVALLEERRERLLAVLVPAEYKDVHLEMVMTLSQWIAGYEGDDSKRVAAEERWNTLVGQYPWIQ